MTNKLTSTLLSLAIFTSGYVSASNIQSEETENLISWIKHGQVMKVEQAIAQGFDINRAMPGDGTPLMLAVENGHKQLVHRLIELGADVNRISLQDGNPLIVAAANNRLELVEHLLLAGADVDAIVKYDETALITAARAGHLAMVKLLVNSGADVNLTVEAETVRGVEIRSPLSGAKTEAVRQYLLQHGATAI